MAAAAVPKGGGRGKSGLHRAGCRLTAGESDLKASATETNRLSLADAPNRQGWNGAVRAHQRLGDQPAR